MPTYYFYLFLCLVLYSTTGAILTDFAITNLCDSVGFVNLISGTIHCSLKD